MTDQSVSSVERLHDLARLIRFFILQSTTAAGSGHPTSSLSAADLMAVLFFGNIFRFNQEDPLYRNNDRLIFSKGHAAPLFYALWAAAGALPVDELMTLRKFGSRLEGHPTMAFPYTEAATGSLGQGLSVGVGMALNAKYVDRLSYRTYVLLGDSEMAEGSVWEAIQIAAYYKLHNLIAVLDVNRLGQRGETMYGHDCASYAKRIAAFGWETIIVDGHDLSSIFNAYKKALAVRGKPVMIIAKTLKGKGISFIENKDGWHGKTLSKEELVIALRELGTVDIAIRGAIMKPEERVVDSVPVQSAAKFFYPREKLISTRKVYGNALARIFPQFPNVVVLDAEVSNSTFVDIFKKQYPERFFEMYIAEQNMVGAALGFSRRGKIPFVSTFSAFFTRAFDQIRMGQYSNANIKFVGSHAGVSIGEDGASQMGLEDIALFRAILGSVVLYPSDAIATERLVEEAARHYGIVYIRTTRSDMPIIYAEDALFRIGGSAVLRESAQDVITVVAAGVTVHEALTAYVELQKEGIHVRVIDLYSVKPLDVQTLIKAAEETKVIITVEDHFSEGGIGEAVATALSGTAIVHCLSVQKMPKSGTSSQLLDYEGISRSAIIKKVKEILL